MSSNVTRPRSRRSALPLALMLPAVAALAVALGYPLLRQVVLSFQEFGLAQQFGRPPEWVGLENYRELWHDTFFRDAVWLTVKFTLITVSFEFALGLIIALVVNSSFKGRGVMRAVMLVPWAIPTVISAQMWKWMYDDVFGPINDLGVRLHILDQMGRARPAVYERSVLDPERPFSDRLAITQTGREVLQGVTDWLSLQPPLRWLGGVRIDPSTPNWRWDEARQDVTMA